MTITAKSSDSAPVFDWLEEIENDPNAKTKNDKSVGIVIGMAWSIGNSACKENSGHGAG